MEATNLKQLSKHIIGGIMTSGVFQQGNLYLEEQDDDDNEPDDIIILHMDIRQPLRVLQKLLVQKTGVSLNGYKFYLQDSQELEPHKNLVDQCVKGEGLIQINVQIQTCNRKINIVDVLKPTDAALAALAAEDVNKNDETPDEDYEMPEEEPYKDRVVKYNKTEISEGSSSTANKGEKPCLNWVLDPKFKKEQARLKIPDNPTQWTVPQVKHWFNWAVRQFNLSGFIINDWAITGSELCALTHEEFHKKMPKDPSNIFWTHIQLLKECKFVSVVHNPDKVLPDVSSRVKQHTIGPKKEPKIMRKTSISLKNNSPVPNDSSAGNSSGSGNSSYGVGSGNNGQVQLWQFLLEILTDREHSDIIQWVGTEGEFKLTDPERVARLWGEKKNKPAMNYEKLSRALRYYYDGDMISKVSGKRFAYKFDCDLKLLIGYDAAELSRLVNERNFIDDLSMDNSKSDNE